MASIRKRGNSYLLVVSMGYTPDGRRRNPQQKTVKPPTGLTPKQTEKWLQEQAMLFEMSCKKLNPDIDRSITLEKYTEIWLQTIAPDKLAKSTLVREKQDIERFKPYLGSYKLVDLRPEHFRSLYAKLRKQTNKATGKPLSEATVEGVHSCLCGILSDAMEGGYLDHNPAWRTYKYAGQKKEKKIADDETVKKLIHALEAGSILYRLAALEEWKNTIVTELLTGTGYSSFADICQDIKELQEALTGSGSETPGVDPSDPGLVEQFNALKAEMAKFDMIQSVVYIPNATEAETGYLLKSSVLKVYNEKLTTADKYETVAQGIASNKIQFRVSPASKANDFIGENAKYTLTFDGSLISKKSFSKVKTAGAPVLVDAESGIIEYSVETEIGENEIWAVCAVIKAVDPQPAEGEESTGSAKDNTDLTTTYFKATRVTDKVKTIEITNDNSSATSLPYMNPDGSNSMLDYSKNRKVVGKAEDGSVIVEDMVGEYGVPTTISYELSTLTNDDKSDDNWFKIENGQLTLPNASNAMIGRKVTVTPVADFGSFQLKAPAYKEVTIARRVVEHDVQETKELTWNKDIQFIALSSDEMDEIIKATELSRGDFMELIDENEPADLTKLCLMTGKDILEKMPAATDKVANDNTLYIVVPAKMNTGEAKKLDITLKEENSSTTQTDSYIIHVNVSKMQYPVTVIEKNPTRWTEDGQTIEYRPQIEWADGTTDKVEGVGNTFNAKDLFADYAALSQQAADLGFTLVIKAKGLTNTDGVSYNSATRALTYDKTQYNGKVVEFEIYLDYNGTKIGATNCKISVQALSGTWTNPTQMAMSVTDLSKTYDVAEGAKWVDVAGRTIWENGAKVKTGQDDKGNWLSDFSKDPFSTAVYGMTAPSFHVIDPKTGAAIADQYVNVNSSTGEVSFTDDAKQASFATAYTVTIRISADSPWGAITNMPDDHVDMTFTIAQGAK